MGAENEFLTGVVEGFYGRPWTYPQRRELFRRMNQMGMNSYLYAPKDDIKHRQSWRELYTVEEEQQLQQLIRESTEAGVLFIFALSPGLDATFSSAKEVETLKRKVDQVSKLGCTAFALLFDDIEQRLCPADREVFSSPARAQVVFANEIYNYLGCPKVFLFCPTEYNASLAVPNIFKSEYLSTLASCLAPGIAVIWTGPLVVSKTITARQLRQLSRLLRHPIVLWDNLHANDYDQRRVFIGPYSGRALTLRRCGLIRGVLTNPNCEFEANYVALHTLAQWSRYGGANACPGNVDAAGRGRSTDGHEEFGEDEEDEVDEDDDDVDEEEEGTELGTNDLETNDGQVVEMAEAGADVAKGASLDPGTGPATDDKKMGSAASANRRYRPRKALLIALRDWLALMLEDQQQQMFHTPQTTCSGSKTSSAAGVTPTPMDMDVLEAGSLPVPLGSTAAAQEAEMQVDVTSGPLQVGAKGVGHIGSDMGVSSVDVTLGDLELFADLFYLPFAHGPAGLRLLDMGHWLLEHSYVCGPNSTDPEKLGEWSSKFTEFSEAVASVGRLRDRIQRLPSRSIAYELAPYVTEVYMVLGMVMDYFNWLETGVMATRTMCHLRRLLTWFSPGYRDMVTSGNQEPWTFRGGLITELQRILPLESAQDLFPAPSRAIPGTAVGTGGVPGWPEVVPPPLPPATTTGGGPLGAGHRGPYYYRVRAYRAEEHRLAIYALFRRLLLARLGIPEENFPQELADLPGDRYLSPFLEHSPETCLVVEGPPFRSNSIVVMEATDTIGTPGHHDHLGPASQQQQTVVGFGLAAASAVTWARGRTVRYREVLRNRYPRAVMEKLLSGDTTTTGGGGDASAAVAMDESSATGLVLKPPVTVRELIKFLLHPFHVETPDVSELAEAASVFPPPEPLGASLPTEPVLSGCLEATASSGHTALPVLLPETAPPSPPAPTADAGASQLTSSGGAGEERAVGEKGMSSSTSPCPVPAGPRPRVPTPTQVVGGGVGSSSGLEALHSALTAHPATLLVELDDLGLGSVPVTPGMLVGHASGLLALDQQQQHQPELLLDSVARRLFVCLLAALKTVGSHGAHVHLDAISEYRTELYRRFGFYPISAASTEQTTVLARLI